MNDPVHILATIRNPALHEAATLVFKTLRTGFPLAPIRVHGNGLTAAGNYQVGEAAASAGAIYLNAAGTSHDAWIEYLVNSQTEPFWVCDTDMVFFRPVLSPPPRPTTLFLGRHEPEFFEEWTNSRHMERLHTCLMWFNPTPLRSAIREWHARIPSPWRETAQFPLIRQTFVPHWGHGGKETTLFYDTCAGLYHALHGTAFSRLEDEAFEHLHCGTYADLVDAPSLADLRSVHQQVFADPSRARGLKQAQDRYYEAKAYAKPI